MESSFWFGYQFKELLFPSVQITSYQGFVSFCLVLFLMAVIYEALKIGAIQASLDTVRAKKLNSQNLEDRRQLISRLHSHGNLRLLFAETALYLLELIFAYLIMLIVMTYNTYFFIIVITVSTLSYFFMGQKILNLHLEISSLNHSASGRNSSASISTVAELPVAVLDSSALRTGSSHQDSDIIIHA